MSASTSFKSCCTAVSFNFAFFNFELMITSDSSHDLMVQLFCCVIRAFDALIDDRGRILVRTSHCCLASKSCNHSPCCSILTLDLDLDRDCACRAGSVSISYRSRARAVLD